MREIILNFAKQFEKGLIAAEHIKLEDKFNKIIICGMGGSALPANILVAYMPDLQIPIYSQRTYNLPKQADKNSLIAAVSYSGNTEETITAYEQALKKGLKTAAISTGGRLREIAEQNNAPIAIIPKDAAQPRFSVGYQSAALFRILSNAGVIPDKTEEILETTNKIDPEKLENQGKTLSQKLIDKIPVIYSSERFKALSRIWKIKFNENAKIMAFFNYFPELNHNEMAGLTNLKGKFHFLILKDKDDHKRVQKRMDLFTELAKEKSADVDIIEMQGNNALEKIINSLILGDWATYYLALSCNQDPTPVKIVEEFKKRLNS